MYVYMHMHTYTYTHISNRHTNTQIHKYTQPSLFLLFCVDGFRADKNVSYFLPIFYLVYDSTFCSQNLMKLDPSIAVLEAAALASMPD